MQCRRLALCRSCVYAGGGGEQGAAFVGEEGGPSDKLMLIGRRVGQRVVLFVSGGALIGR